MLSDLRYSVRTLWRSKVFASSAVLTLALGIGANTAVFAVVNAVLLQPLPYAQPERLVSIWEANPTQGLEHAGVSPGTFVDWRSRSSTLERVGVYFTRDWLLSMDGEVETVRQSDVSPSVFSMLGVRPLIGRTFRAEVDQTPPFGDENEIVISHALWQRRYGGRSDVLGKQIVIEGRRQVTIVGVMPAGFNFPEPQVQTWGNLSFLRPVGTNQRGMRSYEGIAQLREGATLEIARAELTLIAKQLEVEHPVTNAGYETRLQPLDESIVGGVRTRLAVMLGAVACVLLIACANVASLLLARATSRRQEVAVRLALGARWTGVLRQSLADSLVLTSMGAGVGCVLGFVGVKALILVSPAGIPRLDEVAFGAPLLVFSVLFAFGSALVTCLPPVLQARKLDVQATLKAGGRSDTPASARSLRAALIGAQVALTLTLLVGSSLLLRSFLALREVDVGFNSSQVLTTELRVPVNRFPETQRRPWLKLSQHYDEALAQLASIPGVAAVGGVTVLPLTGMRDSATFWKGIRSRRPDAREQFDLDIHVVTPGYFDVMGIRLHRGRAFNASDRLSDAALSQPRVEEEPLPNGAVIVNEAFVRRYLGDSEPLGASIVLFEHFRVESSIIVGVVGDVRGEAVGVPAEPSAYLPFGEMPGFRLTVALRAAGDSAATAGFMRERIRAFDPQMVVSTIQPMGDLVTGSLSGPRFNLLLISAFALLALTLAAIGVYGIVAFLVANRTREIGVRIAIGARSSDVLRLVLKDGLAPVAIGVIAGLLLSVVSVNALRSLLFGVLPFDPPSFVAGATVLLAVAFVAAAVPARRASRVDPTVALRQE